MMDGDGVTRISDFEIGMWSTLEEIDELKNPKEKETPLRNETSSTKIRNCISNSNYNEIDLIFSLRFIFGVI
jgi:hypothetical protein